MCDFAGECAFGWSGHQLLVSRCWHHLLAAVSAISSGNCPRALSVSTGLISFVFSFIWSTFLLIFAIFSSI